MSTIDSKQTLHELIRQDIETRILTGQWPPGYRIPPEHALMERYQCARMTVSKVLTQLVAAGLVERRRRVGSFVRHAPAASAVLQLPNVEQEVQQLGMCYGYRLLHSVRRRSRRDDRIRLDLDADTAVLWLECLHEAAGTPFACEIRLINLAAVPSAAATSFAHQPPGTWLQSHVPWGAAEHRIRAWAADADLAAKLELSPGHPCLVTERRTWTPDGVPVTWASLVSAAECRELRARFSPSLAMQASGN